MTRIASPAWMTAPETARVFSALDRAGGEARFIGGCVRDALIGRPIKDIDVATTLTPGQVFAAVERAGLRAIATGIKHGTVTVLAGESRFEVTTLRLDVETDGRHAKVVFTDDWVADAARRDFTFNALSATPDGLVFDPFGGIADLRAGRVRFVGDPAQRIGEDVLRLLRFFRFQAHFGRGAPEPAAVAACVAAAPRLTTLSGERIRAELLRLLEADDPVPMWRMMVEAGVLAPILPQLLGVDRLARLVAIEDQLASPGDSLLRLAVTIDAEAKTVASRLKLSNVDRDRLVRAVSSNGHLGPDAGPRQWRRALYRLGDAAAYRDQVLCAASRLPVPLPIERLRGVLAVANDLDTLRFPLTGRDLTDLGVSPGPGLGALMRVVERWWIDQDFRADRTACLAVVARLLQSGGVAEGAVRRDECGNELERE